jgi:putative colanic acid biosynthesis UDP-glucose lipid carrier transferase
MKQFVRLALKDLAMVNTSPGQLHSGFEPENLHALLPYSPLERKRNKLLKRGMDLFLSSFFIVCLSWAFILIALLVKLDSKGPVFFLQKRNKRGGRLFTCFKFRTMIVNSDADIIPASDEDARITVIGMILRRHHLDELPQLLNVWWGDMSLIGPRPYMVTDNLKYEHLLEGYHYRHGVKPGITGLAQVLGLAGPVASLRQMKLRTSKDLSYIQQWSLALDVKIMFGTFVKMWGRNKKDMPEAGL